LANKHKYNSKSAEIFECSTFDGKITSVNPLAGTELIPELQSNVPNWLSSENGILLGIAELIGSRLKKVFY
jgi:hypothetical protein